jgi:hypothetical protein
VTLLPLVAAARRLLWLAYTNAASVGNPSFD